MFQGAGHHLRRFLIAIPLLQCFAHFRRRGPELLGRQSDESFDIGILGQQSTGGRVRDDILCRLEEDAVRYRVSDEALDVLERQFRAFGDLHVGYRLVNWKYFGDVVSVHAA